MAQKVSLECVQKLRIVDEEVELVQVQKARLEICCR